MADEAAVRACRLEQSGVGCLRKSVKFCLRNRLRGREWMHERCRLVYRYGVSLVQEDCLERGESVSLSRLRSGHSLELQAYRKRIGLSESDVCRRCGESAEDLVHVWSCGAGELRRRVLGLSGDLGELCKKPIVSLRYWEWWKWGRLQD